jgi:hypothetical protein
LRNAKITDAPPIDNKNISHPNKTMRKASPGMIPVV